MVRERQGALRLDVYAVGDAELEVWAARRQQAAFEKALDRQARIVAHHLKEPDEPARRARKRTRKPRRQLFGASRCAASASAGTPHAASWQLRDEPVTPNLHPGNCSEIGVQYR